jgi:hypothetical protein
MLAYILCSFPIWVVIALSAINERQEHTNIFRLKQLGSLYERWGGMWAYWLRAVPYLSEPNGAHMSDRYEPNESFFYEVMSIVRRGEAAFLSCYCKPWRSSLLQVHAMKLFVV